MPNVLNEAETVGQTGLEIKGIIPQLEEKVEEVEESVAISSRLLLEAKQFSETIEGVPRFKVTEIAQQPVDPKGLAYTLGVLLNTRPRPQALRTLYDNREIVVPDYRTRPFWEVLFSQEHAPLLTPIVDWLQEKSVDYRLDRMRVGKADIPKGVIEQVSKKTKQQIYNLVGPDHEIKMTYRIGDFAATEVIPRQRPIDPLFCHWQGDRGGEVNALFASSFSQAVFGRINNSQSSLRKAVSLAQYAGEVLTSHAIKGDSPVSWGQLFFAGDIIYGKALINGFT